MGGRSYLWPLKATIILSKESWDGNPTGTYKKLNQRSWVRHSYGEWVYFNFLVEMLFE